MIPIPLTILAPVLAAVVAAAAGFWYGWSERSEKAQLELAEAVLDAQGRTDRLNDEIARLDAARQQEARNHAQANDRYHAALRAGAIRLSVPSRVVPGAAAASGVAAQARTELDAEAAVRIDRVANDGDDAIRDLNQCIDLYEAARAALSKGR